jgi:hopanoid biosynthesis associated protein HpnK
VRLLVINADDFGLTPSVNAGIIEAHAGGVVTSASLFAAAPATVDAIRLARENPSLGIGCHLTLVDGQPMLPPHLVPSLVDRDGRFRPTWRSFIGACLIRRVSPAEVTRELEAQVDRLESEGLRLTHLDAHKHVHTCPPVFELVVTVAKRFGIRTVRVPFEEPAVKLFIHSWTHPVARRQAAENLALGPWARQARAVLARHHFSPAPHFFGRVHTGLLTPLTLEQIFARVPEGLSELMTHPGYADETLSRIHTRLRTTRTVEKDSLEDVRTRASVVREGLTLVRHDLLPHVWKESVPHVS